MKQCAFKHFSVFVSKTCETNTKKKRGYASAFLFFLILYASAFHIPIWGLLMTTYLQVWILCNDCGSTSEVQFHIVGQKCPNCKSYNTRQTRWLWIVEWWHNCWLTNAVAHLWLIHWRRLDIQPSWCLAHIPGKTDSVLVLRLVLSGLCVGFIAASISFFLVLIFLFSHSF